MRSSLVAFAVTIFLVLGTRAQAEPILDFNMDAVHLPTASISYDGVGGPLVGIDISVDFVVGLDTPSNANVSLPITDGILSFTTGNFTGSDGDNWFFDAGGSITITGDAGSGPTTLLSGTFTDSFVVQANFFKVAISGFLDTKDEDLADFYGLGNIQQWVGGFNLSFVAPGNPPAGFVSTRVLSGDVVNTVPEPGSIVLQVISALGLAAAGLGARNQRRRKTTAA